jgi:alanine racemase
LCLLFEIPPIIVRLTQHNTLLGIKKVVPAIMVMGASAFAVTFVPDALNRRHGFGLTPIHLLNQCRIHLFTKPHPVRLNLQCFIEKVILAGDNVNKIADASRCVVCTVYMDMDFMQSFT